MRTSARLRLGKRSVVAATLLTVAMLWIPSSANASATGYTCWYSTITASYGGVSVPVPAGCLEDSVYGSGRSISWQYGEDHAFGSKCYYRLDFVDYKTGSSSVVYHHYGHQYYNCSLYAYQTGGSRTVSSTANQACTRYYVNWVKIREACDWIY